MKKIVFLFVIIALPIFSFSQKAYEAIYYSGKTQNITVKFTLASGYIEACEIKTTDNKTKKTSKFIPDNAGISNDKKMRFDHYSSSGKNFTDYFIIEGIEEYYESVPAKMYGKYYFTGVAYNITLIKL